MVGARSYAFYLKNPVIYFAVLLWVTSYFWIGYRGLEHLSLPLVFLGLIALFAWDRKYSFRPVYSAEVSERIEQGALLALFGLTLVLLWLWTRSGGLFLTAGMGEPVGGLLNSYNNVFFNHGLSSIILQDQVTSADPSAHPMYYIHHPNLSSRLITMLIILLGGGLPGRVLVALYLSVFGLALTFLAYRRIFSESFGIAALVFALISYSTFYWIAGDPVRGEPAITLACIFYLLSIHPKLNSKWANTALGILILFSALSDWSQFIYIGALFGLWVIYINREIPWKKLFWILVFPTFCALSFYLSVIINTIGFDFFLFDLKYNLVRKNGQFEYSGIEKGIFSLYQKHHLVLWDRPSYRSELNSFIANYLSFFNRGSASAKNIYIWATQLAFFYFFLSRQFRHWLLFLLSFSIFYVGDFQHDHHLSSLIVIIPFLLLTLMTAWTEESTPKIPILNQVYEKFNSIFSPACRDVMVFVVLVYLSMLASWIIFPSYLETLLIPSRLPPVIFPEIAVFTLMIGFLIEVIFRAKKAGIPILSWVCTAGLLFWLFSDIQSNYRYYEKYPPGQPEFAEELSKNIYRGKTVVTNGNYVLPWLYTKAAVFTPNGQLYEPGKIETDAPVFADWDTNPVYQNPDYYLCVHSFLTGPVGLLDGQKMASQCAQPNNCDCVDIARFMALRGFQTVTANAAYAIIKMKP